MARIPAALTVAAVLLLTGCSALPQLTPHRRGGTAATPAALALAWSTPATQPGWLPPDATDIRWAAATAGGADRAPAALLARTASRLPASCLPDQQVARVAIAASWAPREVPERAARCGGWAVVAVRGGWFAWTPAED